MITAVKNCFLFGRRVTLMLWAAVDYNNIRSRCGPGNAYFISIHQVSLPVDFWYFASY